MHFSTLLVPALAAFASAQSTTVVSIFEAIVNDTPYSISYSMEQSVGASVVGVNADYTTYAVDCMSGAPISECSIDTPYTILAGPTTLSYSKPLPIDIGGTIVTVNQDVQCSFTHKSESAVCTGSEKVSFEGHHTATVVTKSIPTQDVTFMAITVTAGLSKFNSPQATQAPNAAAGSQHPMVTAAPLGAAAALAVAALL